jgi:penicillin amidase
MADRVDLFVERINPNDPSKYWYVDHWEDMRIKKVEIRVKENEAHKSITKEINYTRHGPVINHFKEGIEGVISMRWTGGVVQDQTLMAIRSLNRAKNIEEAKEGKNYAKIYTLNMVYADVDGNIGYQLIGGIPLRGKGALVRQGSLRGNLPVIGWDDEYEWQGFIPDNELPNISNPRANFIATANNKIVSDDFPYLISNSWAPPNRYERIVSRLQEKQKLSLEDFKRIQADVYSAPARRLVGEILKVQPHNRELRWVLEELSGWNFEVTPTSLPALLYEVLRVNLLRNTFRDELGEIYPDFLYTLNFNYNIMDKIISDSQSQWWDDISTPQREDRDEIVVKTVEHALREIEQRLGVDKEKWAWGELHQYKFVHPLGQVRLLDKIFNFKPVPAEGDRDTINDSYFSYANPYDATTVPSYRFIIDLSDISNALGMNSTGQSGNPFSGRYSDTIEDWAQTKYHPLLFDDREIEENQWKELILRP